MKLKLLIPLLLVIFTFTSCTQTYVERVSADYWKVIDIDVPASSWTYYSSTGNKEGYFQADVSIPELTSYVYTDGFVLCYLYNNGSQCQLPYVRHYETTNSEIWTSTIDYEYFVGGIHLFYTNNDFHYESAEPGAMRFRLVLQW